MARVWYYRDGRWRPLRWWHRLIPPDYFDEYYGQRHVRPRYHCPVADCDHGERE